MPLVLNLRNRPVVEDAFKDALITYWKKRWKAMNDQILQSSSYSRNMVVRENAAVMTRLKTLCTDPHYLDLEYAKLYTLPYQKFMIKEYAGRKWFMGLTHPIILTDGLKQWQGPRYYVCFPEDVDEREAKYAFHFLPQGYENTRWRHPHHRGTNPHLGIWDSQPETIRGNPLGSESDTCWGSFGTIVTSCIASGDLVDLFRVLHTYLSRVDMHSLLIHPFNRGNFFKQIDDLPVPDKVLQPQAYALWEVQQQKLERKKRR